jgi:hypothetical protein
MSAWTGPAGLEPRRGPRDQTETTPGQRSRFSRADSGYLLKMLRCIECGAESKRGLGWEARIGYDPEEDDPAEVVVFCPVCAVREFGQSGVPWFERRVP